MYLVVADESDTINIISVVVDNNVKLECNEGMFTVDNDNLNFTYKDDDFITLDVIMIENRLCDFKTQKYILIKGKDCTRQLTTKKNQSDLQ